MQLWLTFLWWLVMLNIFFYMCIGYLYFILKATFCFFHFLFIDWAEKNCCNWRLLYWANEGGLGRANSLSFLSCVGSRFSKDIKWDIHRWPESRIETSKLWGIKVINGGGGQAGVWAAKPICTYRKGWGAASVGRALATQLWRPEFRSLVPIPFQMQLGASVIPRPLWWDKRTQGTLGDS